MKKQNKVGKFIREHKRGIYITAGVIGGLILCFFGVKIYLKRPSLARFLNDSSIDMIRSKRDEVHNEYLSYTKNDNYRNGLYKLLEVLDTEIRKRECAGKVPSPPSYPREHGHNLYKPD